MSVSTLFKKNHYDINCKSLNGITQEEITGANENGQVLTLVNKELKLVAFTDPQGTTPPTLGEPDGYVLAIKNNVTGELEWKQDAQGSIPDPLVLSGANSVNKFQVRDALNDPKFTVDTTNNQTQLTALNNRVEGADDEKKFGVYTSADGVNGIVEISTFNTATGLTVQGQNASHKFRVKDNTGVEIFNVDTLNNGITEFKNQVNNAKLRVETVDGKIEMYNSNAFDTKLTLFNDNVGLNSYSISTQPDGGTTTIFAQDTINTITNNFNLSSKFTQGGTDSKDKFQIKNNTGTNIFKVDTLGSGSVTVGGPDSAGKVAVFNGTGQTILQVNTTDRRLTVGTTDKEATINSNITPETLPIIGVPSSVNMKVEQTTGDTNFVGYMARNGNSYVFNLVNDTQSGLFLISSVASGIQTSAPVMSISSSTPSSVCNIDFTNYIYLQGQNSNRIYVGNSDGVQILSQDNLTLESVDGVIACLSPVEFLNSYPSLNGITAFPTLSNQLTSKAYVDDKVGGLSSGILPSPQAIGNVVGIQSLNPTTFSPSNPSIPPNYLKQGQSYQLVMSGTAQFSNGNNFTISLRASNNGSPVVLGSVQIIVPNVSGAQTWELEGDFTIRQIGLNSIIVCSFDFTYNDGQNFIGKRSLTTSNTLDSSQPQTLNTVVSFTSGTASDNLQTELYILKKVVDV